MTISPEMIAEARAVPIAEAVAAYAPDLKRAGAELVGPCPVCGGRDRFAVHPRRGIFNCRFCDVGGDVLDLVRHVEGVSFVEAVEVLTGTSPGSYQPPGPIERMQARAVSRLAEQAEAERIENGRQSARRRFSEGSPDLGITGTYLRDVRKLSGFDDLAGKVLRFHPRLPWRQDDDTLINVPGLMSAMTNIVTGEISGIIRVALTTDGRKIARKTLGVARGAGVRLDRDGEDPAVLTVVEGVETGIAARMLGLPRVWAVAGTAGLANLPVLNEVERINLCAENDANGASDRAIAACGARWEAAGRSVHIIRPPAGCSDLNDIVMRG